MAENSGIEWTDHTFNPWIGCTKVSAACDHMQPAYRISARRIKDQTTGPTPKRAKVKAARKQRHRNG